REVRRVVVRLLAVGVTAAVQRPRPLLRRELLLRTLDDRTRVGRVAVIVPGPDALDVDDFGAEMREQARRPRPDGLPREGEGADSAEDAGGHGVHRIPPAAASASMCVAGRPRSPSSTSRVCSPRCGARPRGAIPSASAMYGPRG